MKITTEDIWNHIGTVFHNPEDLNSVPSEEDDFSFVVLPKGTYLIVDAEDSVVYLYDIEKNINHSFEPYFVPFTEFETVYIQPEEMLRLIIDSLTKKIVTLTSEGWSVDSDNKHFDLTPELQKLAAIKYTLGVLDPESLMKIERENDTNETP